MDGRKVRTPIWRLRCAVPYPADGTRAYHRVGSESAYLAIAPRLLNTSRFSLAFRVAFQVLQLGYPSKPRTRQDVRFW